MSNGLLPDPDAFRYIGQAYTAASTGNKREKPSYRRLWRRRSPTPHHAGARTGYGEQGYFRVDGSLPVLALRKPRRGHEWRSQPGLRRCIRDFGKSRCGRPHDARTRCQWRSSQSYSGLAKCQIPSGIVREGAAGGLAAALADEAIQSVQVAKEVLPKMSSPAQYGYRRCLRCGGAALPRGGWTCSDA